MAIAAVIDLDIPCDWNAETLLEVCLYVLLVFVANSLNITVSVCYVSVSKVNRKERIRPFLFVCFVLPCQIYIINFKIADYLVPSLVSVMIGVWNRPRKLEPAMIPVSYFVSFFIYFRFKVILLLLLFYFFLWIFFSCSGMFRDVPEYSGMFRVPCSWFYRRPNLM